MPNYEFKQVRSLLKYIRSEESRCDEYWGTVIRHDFDLDAEIELLESAHWPAADIIEYIIASNPVLWAQYYLKNPQNPSEQLQLFTHQKNLINCQNRYKLSRCGRQVGKTVSMSIDMLHSAMTNQHLRILYVAPFQSQVKNMYEKTMMPMMYDVPEVSNSISKKPAHPFYQAIFNNKSEISAMTAGTRSGQKGASIRGTSADRLYLDEVDFMGSEAINAVWGVMMARPEAKLWISSTPTGKREEFYHYAVDSNSDFICLSCREHDRDGSPFHYPAHVNPLYTEGMDRHARNQMTAADYEHEVDAEWGEEAEGVFRHTDIDACLELGRRVVIVDESTGEEKQISYTYDELVPDNRCIYILGVDWNKESTGVQLCVTEYNPHTETINRLPPKMYRVFRTEIITAKEFTEGSAVSRIMALDREIPLAHVYSDAGYGTTQIEALKKMAMINNRIPLARKIAAIEMSSIQEVYDPLTREKIKKPMKAFMVDNSSRIVEARRIMLPDVEDEKVKLVGQMREYVVIRRAESGHPVYSRNNEDMLTAFMLALLGYAREYSELVKMASFNKITVTKSGITTRAFKHITPRWGMRGGSKVDLQEKYGIGGREPAFRELAESLDLPYSYTTDSRPEELRPIVTTVVNRESIRGSRNIGRSSRRPTRRRF